MPQTFRYDDAQTARDYAAGGPRRVVPGYDMLHRLTVQVLSEQAGETGHILVLGAGGGLEIAAMANAQPAWHFTGVDPSRDMITSGKTATRDHHARIDWVQDYIMDAPQGPFDGATCLLLLHFLPDDGQKLQTLKAIRERLKPGARFVLADTCLPDDGLRKRRARRYRDFFTQSGAEPDTVDAITQDMLDTMPMVSAEREVELLQEAGFTDIDLIFAGLAWRGWVAIA